MAADGARITRGIEIIRRLLVAPATRQELAEVFGISTRQLRRDVIAINAGGLVAIESTSGPLFIDDEARAGLAALAGHPVTEE